MLQEVLLIKFLLEALHLSFELLVLEREQLGLEDDLPAMVHQAGLIPVQARPLSSSCPP